MQCDAVNTHSQCSYTVLIIVYFYYSSCFCDTVGTVYSRYVMFVVLVSLACYNAVRSLVTEG